jgi:hypothetical protein
MYAPRKVDCLSAERCVREAGCARALVTRNRYRPPAPPASESRLATLLAVAVTDTYQRRGSKTARYRPNKKGKPSCGAPIVSGATVEHRKKLKQLDLQLAA